MRYFIVSFTNRVKDYCDTEFFKRFNEIAAGYPTLVVDNTPGRAYYDKLACLTPYVAHIDVDPGDALFQRNVAESVQLCRKRFLESDADVMVIIESDVIPPIDLIRDLGLTINHLDNGHTISKPWGIIGGLYYPGFHDFSQEGLHETHHVLSGCTVYRRELLEKYPFRYDPANLGAFPDAIICHDAKGDYTFWNDHNIMCKHLHRGDGGRMSHEL